MKPAYWKRVKELAADTLELPGHQRQAFLQERCGKDRKLYKAVLDLTRVDHRSIEPLVTLRPTAEIPGQVGQYRPKRLLGRGGMGVVYLASHEATPDENVALKLFPRGVGLGRNILFFHHEKRFLADLYHPCIAKYYDAGMTKSQTAYIVMEHVDGLPIGSHCVQHKLSLPLRLELFIQVCGAVHYAHEELVVHSDLKPSNILVRSDNAPKLLDFGISCNATGFFESEVARRACTPEFASPEQVSNGVATIASDIYSLGRILQLLFVLDDDDSEENETPLRDRFRNSLDLHALRAAIESIVVKATNPDPSARYSSAKELSDEVESCLQSLSRRRLSHVGRAAWGTFFRKSKY